MNPIAIIGLASAGVSLAQETIKGLSNAKDLVLGASSTSAVSFDQHLEAELKGTSVDLRPYLDQNGLKDVGGLHAHIEGLTEELMSDPAVAAWAKEATGDIRLEHDAHGNTYLCDELGRTFNFSTEKTSTLGPLLHRLYALEASAAQQPTVALSHLAAHVEAKLPVGMAFA